MQYPRGSQPPLDVPIRDSGPVPKDQLRKLADIYMDDMGMTPDEVLSTPEFAEQGITDLRQLDEAMADEPIRMIPGDSFGAQAPRSKKTPSAGFKDTIVLSPAGDSVLVAGQETDPDDIDGTLEALTGQTIGYGDLAKLEALLKKQMDKGYVEIPISWSPNTGWKF